MSAKSVISAADKLSMDVNAGTALAYLKISDSSRLIAREMIDPVFFNKRLTEVVGKLMLPSLDLTFEFDHSRFDNVAEATCCLLSRIACGAARQFSRDRHVSQCAKQNVVFGERGLDGGQRVNR